jgi:hypothetical protein
MAKVPEYKFIDEMMVGHDTCPIRIMEGQFAGIVYKYGKISLEEVEGDNLKVNMDITMVEGPESFNQQDANFTQTVGEIFVDIVEKNALEVAQKEPTDLEDDVHQD